MARMPNSIPAFPGRERVRGAYGELNWLKANGGPDAGERTAGQDDDIRDRRMVRTTQLDLGLAASLGKTPIGILYGRFR